MPGRQPSGDEQAEPVGVGQAHVQRLGQLGVELVKLVSRNPKTPVGYLDSEAVGHPLRPNLDPGARRGEQRRVLDQLGQQVDHVGDGDGGHRLLGVGDDGDPGVVLNLGGGCAHDVDDRHRAAPRAAGGRAGQDREALRVPSHPGGEVVEREQLGERAWARRLLLQGVDDAQLTVQQRLIPAAEAGQDLPEAVPQRRFRLLGRGGLLAGAALRRRDPSLGLEPDATREPVHEQGGDQDDDQPGPRQHGRADQRAMPPHRRPEPVQVVGRAAEHHPGEHPPEHQQAADRCYQVRDEMDVGRMTRRALG